MSKPILVLQMQRMGDLILSFPLFLWLEREFPGRDIWVLAEKSFYEPLMPVSPKVTYFPWEGTDFLLAHEFEMVINLSIRTRAAKLAGAVTAKEKLGPVQQENATYIRGPWQLYRASLVMNNRYNRFHWADLNALDAIALPRMAATSYSAPRINAESNPQVGLFLGASEPAKHPDPMFWAELCRELVTRNIRPALFGGPGEKELSKKVLQFFGSPIANFCGRFGLDQLTRAMHTLALFVTPDTGPMHLAAWTACPTLNLSMGNVNPWETGPYTPGHTILRADMACARGCWECTRSKLYCHEPFKPATVAAFIARMAKGHSATNPPPKLTLALSSRNNAGLFSLQSKGNSKNQAHDLLSEFWQAFFGWRLGLWDEEKARTAARALAEETPQAASALAAPLPGLVKALKGGLASGIAPRLWENSPDPIRPFTGWADLHLQNEDGCSKALATLLENLDALMALTPS